MTSKSTTIILLAGVILLALAVAIVGALGPSENVQFQNGATALAFIGAAALGIERFLELSWTVVGGWAGTFWPLTAVTKAVRALEDELTSALRPFHDQATAALDEAVQKGLATKESVAAAQVEVQRLWNHLGEMRKLSPETQRTQLMAAAAAQSVAYLQERFKGILPNLEGSAAAAKVAIDGLQKFVASFKDNPGRRLISLLVGAVLGVLISGMYGLDLFQTAMEVPAGEMAYSFLNVVLTGIIIGLGSSPTHEVVRAVQEYKKSRKGMNVMLPNLP